MRRLILGVAILLLTYFVANAAEHPLIQKGVLDLSKYSWEKDGITELTGEWEFYWNKFYPPAFFSGTYSRPDAYAFVPSFWNESVPGGGKWKPALGYATYRVLIKCPPDRQQLALKFLTVESAYRLFVNGKEILNVGYADTTLAGTVANLKPVIVNVTAENNTLDLVIQVSNFHNRVGGLWDFIRLGTPEQVQAKFVSNISLEFFVAGCFFLAGVYFLVLFAYFKKRYILLYFSLFCFLLFARTMVTVEVPLLYVSNWNWEVTRRLEFISVFLTVPVLALFSYHLFPEDFNGKLLYVILPVCGLFFLLSILGSYYQYTYVIRYYEIFMLACLLYGVYVYVKAAINKRPGSRLFLTGFLILLTTAVNDILYANMLIHTVPLLFAGLAFFIVILAVMLAKQFSENFYALRIANKQLSINNNELAVKNTEIEEKNAELKKINAEMDAFVNRTSHDLRAPLTSVLGITRLAKQEPVSESIQKYLSMQEKTLIRMDSLISDIIDFSKNKRLDLELKEIDFEQMVKHSLEDHAFLYNAHQIEKKTDIKQYEKFVSDPRRVNIIINNLISNAIKYADLSKPIPEISVTISVADNMATIEVADNGIGIEEKHLDKIFTLFYRITNSTTGSGLGLYIIKETVEKLGGYVIINSRKGDGTTIKVMLPNLGYRL